MNRPQILLKIDVICIFQELASFHRFSMEWVVKSAQENSALCLRLLPLFHISPLYLFSLAPNNFNLYFPQLKDSRRGAIVNKLMVTGRKIKRISTRSLISHVAEWLDFGMIQLLHKWGEEVLFVSVPKNPLFILPTHNYSPSKLTVRPTICQSRISSKQNMRKKISVRSIK